MVQNVSQTQLSPKQQVQKIQPVKPTKPVGVQTFQNVVPGKKDKKWIVALILSILLGCFGVDRFYMEYIWQGILKLVTLGGLGIWWLIDLILIATKHEFGKVNWVE